MKPAQKPWPRSRKRDPNRQRIVDAARVHFFSHGFRSVTMDDLAQELGISKKTLYAHFPGKFDLLERSEEHTSELQSPYDLVCRLLLEKKTYHFPRSPDGSRRPCHQRHRDRATHGSRGRHHPSCFSRQPHCHNQLRSRYDLSRHPSPPG